MDKPAIERLLEIGFERAGYWELIDDEPHIEVERYASAANVLYAFVTDRELLYIGRSGRSLQLRMSGYENGGPPRSMRERNRERIIAMLVIDHPIDLYVMPDPGNLHYGSFRVNLAAGLQYSLIEALSPPWNKGASSRGGTRPKSSRSKAARPRYPGRGPRTFSDGDDLEYTDLTIDRPSYRFLVGYVYRDKGFFNVPMRYSRMFGKDRERIKILCGADKETIYGHIDRSTNTNASPRVIGGSSLRSWFEENADINSPVDIDILAPNAVWIRNPGTGDL
jgi:hypothetical protein